MNNLTMGEPKLGRPSLGIVVIRSEDQVKEMITALENDGKADMAKALLRYLDCGDYGDRDVEPGYWLTNKYSVLGDEYGI